MSSNTSIITETNKADQAGVEKRSTHRRVRLVWLWLLLFAVFAGSGYWFFGRSRANQPARGERRAGAAPAAVLVKAATAQKGEIPVYLNGLGSVTPLNTVTVRSRVDGQLINVAFREGQFVRQGELLAEIDSRPFEVQLAQAQAQLARDQAQLNNAKADLERYRFLSQQGIIPKQQFDTQAATVSQDDAVLKVDQAQIDNANLQLTYTRITAPISGRIGLRQVDPGNMIHATDANGLVIITQIQPIAVLFTIPEDSLKPVLQKLRAGERMPVEAYDRSGQTKIAAGRLLTIDNQIDQSTGTTRLKSSFDNKDNSLFPNQFVNVRLLVETKSNAILIPSVAIQRGPRGTFVYLIKPDQTVEVRQVTSGITEGNNTAIEKGLNAGEQVVIDGMDKLREGSKVQVSSPQRQGP